VGSRALSSTRHRFQGDYGDRLPHRVRPTQGDEGTCEAHRAAPRERRRGCQGGGCVAEDVRQVADANEFAQARVGYSWQGEAEEGSQAVTTLPEELIDDVAFASTHLRSLRERARVLAIAAVRGYRAARARSSSKRDEYSPFEPLPEPKAGQEHGREVLVVTADGVLEMARSVRRDRHFWAESRRAEDADLVVEDVEHLARLFPRLLADHIE